MLVGKKFVFSALNSNHLIRVKIN